LGHGWGEQPLPRRGEAAGPVGEPVPRPSDPQETTRARRPLQRPAGVSGCDRGRSLPVRRLHDVPRSLRLFGPRAQWLGSPERLPGSQQRDCADRQRAPAMATARRGRTRR
jgi:hypothetical protein